MFQGRKRGTLKRAIDRAKDPEIRELREEIAQRQEWVAQLELELSDTSAELTRFERVYETRLGPLQRRLNDLEAQLREARHREAIKAQWGDRAGEPDIPDVVEQFRRTWTRPEKPSEPPPEKTIDDDAKKELKILFRTLAKRFHPDLVTDPEQKRRRARTMAKINEAYAANDLASLKALVEEPTEPEVAPRKERGEIIAELYKEIRRLDGVIVKLQNELQRLTNSHMVRLMLDVTIAQRAGEDLLAELAADLQAEITRKEIELASIG